MEPLEPSVASTQLLGEKVYILGLDEETGLGMGRRD
jgi:hypothetical protein